MPKDTKDSNGGKDHPVKESGAKTEKKENKSSDHKKTDSPTGSHGKGEKKTTP